MDSSVFVEKLHSKLLLVQKIARNTAFTFLLVSLLIPISSQVVSTQAHDSGSVNSNTKVKVEKVMKDNTREIKEMTLAELNSDQELTSLSKSNFEQTDQIKQTNLNLTPDTIKQIEAQKGVVYESAVAVVNPSILTNLGYTMEQIQAIQNMANFYNSQTIKSLQMTFDDLKVSKSKPNFFTVQAEAACQYESRISWQIWGAEIWLNNCLIEEIKVGVLVGDAIAVVIGLASGATLTPLGVIIAASINLYVGILDAKNGQCGNQGANLNVLYNNNNSLMWISSVC
jgi:hypothetical protein